MVSAFNYFDDDNSLSLSQVLVAGDGAIQTANLFGLNLILQDDGAQTRFLLADGLGSIRQETANDAIQTATTYEPYGNVLAQTGPSGTTYGFTGEQRDAATGLLYLRARYYNPGLKIFMSRDPFPGYAKSPISQNGYNYAHANPVNLTDPTGNCADPVSGTICIVVGGVVVVVVIYVAARAITDALVPLVPQMSTAAADFVAGCRTLLFSNPHQKQPQTQTDTQPKVTWEDLTPPEVMIDIAPLPGPQSGPRPTPFPPIPDKPTPDPSQYLYHYTEASNVPSILLTGLRPSIQVPGDPSSDAQWGDGQYFTDLTPEEAASATRYQVSRALFNTPWNWGRPPNLQTIGWLKIDVQGLDVRREASLFTQRFGHRSIYRHPGTINLPVADRVLATGSIQFQPSASGYR